VLDFLVGVGLSSKDIPAFRFPLGVGVDATGEVSPGHSMRIRNTHPEPVCRVQTQGK
jgi:hypothetical protein